MMDYVSPEQSIYAAEIGGQTQGYVLIHDGKAVMRRGRRERDLVVKSFGSLSEAVEHAQRPCIRELLVPCESGLEKLAKGMGVALETSANGSMSLEGFKERFRKLTETEMQQIPVGVS